jgi:hypothetical protein
MDPFADPGALEIFTFNIPSCVEENNNGFWIKGTFDPVSHIQIFSVQSNPKDSSTCIKNTFLR